MVFLADPSDQRTAQPRVSFVFALVAIGLDALGVGIIAPIVPQLVQQLAHLPPNRAAPWVGALIAAYAGMQFLFSPLLGALSDRFGRRPVILGSVAGIGFDYVLLALAPTLPWLFVGRLVAGATSANVAAATAFIADVSTTEERVTRFGLVGAAFGGGFVVGPALGGLLGQWGLRLPFWVAAGLALGNAAYGLFVMPESLSPEKRRPLEWRRINPVTAIGTAWRDPALRRLALAWSCSWIGLGAVQSSLVLFAGYRFGWGAGLSGVLLAGIGLSQAVVEGTLLRNVTNWLGESGTALAGYVAATLGYAVVALAFTGWMMLPAVALLTVGGLAMPSVRAIVSRRGKVDNQGEMQGVLTAVEGVTALVAPLLTAGLFYVFTSPVLPVRFAGAPFALAAVATAGAGVLLLRLRRAGEG